MVAANYEVYTDGSAIPNPGPGGWAAVLVIDGDVADSISGGERATTNNRMELTAIIRAFDLLQPVVPATIHSDSNLAVRTINEWAAGWKRRGWTRKTGPVENLDLVEPLYEQFQRHPEVKLVWIKAHAGHRFNEMADLLANEAAHLQR